MFLTVAFLLSAGLLLFCRDRKQENTHPVSETNFAVVVQNQNNGSRKGMAVMSDQETILHKLAELRVKGEWDAYVQEAECYLSQNRDDILAFDVMGVYAKRHDEAAFLSLARRYAKDDNRLMIAFAEIARNTGWTEMKNRLSVALIRDGNFAIAYRSAQFLAEGGKWDVIAEQIDSVEAEAEKRYQKEDVALLKCRCSIARGVAGTETLTILNNLADDAMMPQVRAEAKRLSQEIHK